MVTQSRRNLSLFSIDQSKDSYLSYLDDVITENDPSAATGSRPLEQTPAGLKVRDLSPSTKATSKTVVDGEATAVEME
ncbi:hypothetical protein HID58_000940 [Brassica napus]|uniref:Uncharacterized protein n=1 Tax=Brassica napus TaxID=3708 RepID=A0ABQ8EKQ3_BRANA|nr:hypothetical protein HID58_000940 [Brassica napus]